MLSRAQDLRALLTYCVVSLETNEISENNKKNIETTLLPQSIKKSRYSELLGQNKKLN